MQHSEQSGAVQGVSTKEHGLPTTAPLPTSQTVASATQHATSLSSCPPTSTSQPAPSAGFLNSLQLAHSALDAADGRVANQILLPQSELQYLERLEAEGHLIDAAPAFVVTQIKTQHELLRIFQARCLNSQNPGPVMLQSLKVTSENLQNNLLGQMNAAERDVRLRLEVLRNVPSSSLL